MKNFFTAFFGLLIAFGSRGQSASNPVVYPQMSPPSPEASALGRYGEFPVTLATGTPNVSIPIFNIKSGKLSLPINISYHASGIRVNDVASRVGLGWSLQAGGVISRAVKGLPDDLGTVGYYTGGIPPSSESDNASSCFIGNLVINGTVDGQPDDFFYSFGGKSGKFLFTNRRITPGSLPIAVPIPYDLTKINWVGYNEFTITDVDGTLYNFGNSFSGQPAYENTYSQNINGAAYGGDYPYISAWYLTEVISADKSDTIKLKYTNKYFVPCETHISTSLKDDVYDPATFAPDNVTMSHGFENNSVDEIRLTEIDFRNGKVNFEYASPRADVRNDTLLTGIRIYQYSNGIYSQIKRFVFKQSYFLCNNIAPQNPLYPNINPDPSGGSARLRLDGLQEVDINGNTLPPYTFGYAPNNLPYVGSCAQDYWGFYNGATGNSNLLIYGWVSASQAPSVAYGANRNSNPDSIGASMLTRITFPTGGYTNFQYECNTYNAAPVGGLRIKKIVSYDGMGNGVTKTYNYFNETPISDLFTGSIPTLGSSLLYPLRQGEAFSPSNSNAVTRTYYTYQENFNYPLGASNGAAVCYGRVEELFDSIGGMNGKNVYTYTTYQDQTPSITPENTVTVEWRRGEGLTEQTYKTTTPGNFILLRSKQNIYTYNDRPNLPIVSLSARASYLDQYDDALQLKTYIPGCEISTGNVFLSVFNPVLVGNDYLTQQIDTLFDQNGLNPKITVTNYFYDDTLNTRPVRIESTDSKGNLTKAINWTPLEKNSINSSLALTANASAAIDAMVAQNNLSPVIEQQKFVGTTMTLQTRTNYNIYAPNLIAPSDMQLQVLNNPIETRIKFRSYDRYGNIVSGSKTGDVIMTYIWDYQKSFVIAAVENADSSYVAYTSFESDGSGNWSIPSASRDSFNFITGTKSYNLSNGAITKSGLTTGSTYLVTYWSRNGSYSIAGGTVSTRSGRNVNGWTYYEHTVTTSSSTISINGSGNIDELRLFPQGAMMTTYTYMPLVGLTSKADPNSEITYYEYDGFQRLKNVKDYQGNIIKNYQYNYGTSCGTNCSVLPMQTMSGTNTISYPVGVFNVNGKLLGNATTQAQYITLWMADTADSHTGTIVAGSDSMHFNFTLNTGRLVPSALTGLRYYQVDLSYNVIDAIRSINGAYVDFGDGSGFQINNSPSTGLPPNTTLNFFPGSTVAYYVHTYPNSNLKTITLYHNDATEYPDFDNFYNPSTSLDSIKNFRGNLPQFTYVIGGSGYQQASMNTVSNITNWNSISSVTIFSPANGDNQNPSKNMKYMQDFMANNKGLLDIHTDSYGPYRCGYRDTTFKLTRLKSDWNTYFTNLTDMRINEDHWNHEDLSGLKNLATFMLNATTTSHQDVNGQVLIPLTTSVIDNCLNQIASGAGNAGVKNGYISINAGGTLRTAASNAAVTQLDAAGWVIYLDGVVQ